MALVREWHFGDGTQAGVQFYRQLELALDEIASGFNYLSGLKLANNAGDATNDIDIATGIASDTASAYLMALPASLTKRLDAAWAVGTNQGGRDAGAIGDATWHVFLIRRPDTGVVDALFSASATAPTMPANYTQKRRIGSIIRTAGAILAFVQDGDYFCHAAIISDISALNPGTAAVTRTLTVPLGIRVRADIVVGFDATVPATDAPGSILISDLSIPDQAPSVVVATTFDYRASENFLAPAGAGVWTNTSGQVRSRIQISTAGTRLRILTRGWTDPRGKDG